jgi:hypothetical protein
MHFNKERKQMNAIKTKKNRGLWFLPLSMGLLIASIFAFQSAFALTDYVFFSVNGDTTGTVMTQGDSIGWGSNCETGAMTMWEIWLDINHNDVIDSLVDYNLVTYSAADGDVSPSGGLPDINPVPDGWYITPEMIIAIAPGQYIFRATDLSDTTTDQIIVACSPMSSPPNIFSGHVTIVGHPAPDSIHLRNIWVEADLMGEELQMWAALTDDSGYFEIPVGGVGTGQQYEIMSTNIPGYVTPASQIQTASGIITNIDFDYTAPTDSLYGQIKDENGTVITIPARVYCNPMFSGAGNKDVQSVDGNYCIYFGSSEHGLWYAGVSQDNLVPTYVVPDGFGFDNDTSSSIYHDFVCYTADTVLFARVTENGATPSHQYMLYAQSDSLRCQTVSVSDTGAANVATLHITSQDMSHWRLDVSSWDDRYPIPAGYILEGGSSGNHQPGDTVALNFISGVAVHDTLKLDPGDQPINWFYTNIGLNNGNANYHSNPDNNGVFAIYADTGTYSMNVFCNGYLNDPPNRTVHLTHDTTGGLGFTMNWTHCRVTGTLVNASLPIPYDLALIAHTGDGYSGYRASTMVDRNTGNYVLILCDGVWTIDPPNLQNRQAPTPPVITINEVPDTVRVVDIVYTVLGVDNTDQLPTQFNLMQNYPNPFNSSTAIEFNLAAKTHVTIEVVNLLGEKVKTLIDKDTPAGTHRVNWNGTDNSNKTVSSGLYLYRIKAGNFDQTRKMLLLK